MVKGWNRTEEGGAPSDPPHLLQQNFCAHHTPCLPSSPPIQDAQSNWGGVSSQETQETVRMFEFSTFLFRKLTGQLFEEQKSDVE